MLITQPADSYSFVDTGIFIKADGTRALTGDWNIGASRKIQAEAIWARSSAGLALYDDAGNAGNLGGCVMADEIVKIDENTYEVVQRNRVDLKEEKWV